MDIEPAAPQCTVYVQELERSLPQPGGVIGVQVENGRGLVRGERSQEAGGVGRQHVRLEQEEQAAGGTRRMPALRVPGTYPQPLAAGDGPRDVVDIVEQLTLGDEDQVRKGEGWLDRIAEAEGRGPAPRDEGLRLSPAGAESKINQIDTKSPTVR